MIRAALIGFGIAATVVITAALVGLYADRRTRKPVAFKAT